MSWNRLRFIHLNIYALFVSAGHILGSCVIFSNGIDINPE